MTNTPSTFCCHVWGNYYSDWVAIAMTDGRLGFNTFDQSRRMPNLCDAIAASDDVAIDESRHSVYVSCYDNGTITAYSLRSGGRLWQVGGLPEISSVCVAAAGRVVGRQINGTSVELDAITGTVLRRQRRVREIFCDSMRPLRALNRGQSRSPALGLEIYGDSLDEPLYVERRPCDDLASVVFGSDYMVYGSHSTLSLRCLSLRGDERWVFQLGAQWQYPCISCVDDDTIYALAHALSRATPTFGLLIDARSGSLIAQHEFSNSEKSFVPIANGRIIAERHGYRSLPDMRWHAINYSI